VQVQGVFQTTEETDTRSREIRMYFKTQEVKQTTVVFRTSGEYYDADAAY
jgi:hypothetical protein